MNWDEEWNKYICKSTLGFGITTRWMRVMMVVMNIDAKASKIWLAAAMIPSLSFPADPFWRWGFMLLWHVAPLYFWSLICLHEVTGFDDTKLLTHGAIILYGRGWQYYCPLKLELMSSRFVSLAWHSGAWEVVWKSFIASNNHVYFQKCPFKLISSLTPRFVRS
jgi:hypothetical protein